MDFYEAKRRILAEGCPLCGGRETQDHDFAVRLARYILLETRFVDMNEFQDIPNARIQLICLIKEECTYYDPKEIAEVLELERMLK